MSKIGIILLGELRKYGPIGDKQKKTRYEDLNSNDNITAPFSG